MDRCHRIGQTRPVLVLRLATAHSVEGAMLRKAAGKRALERVVIKRGAFKEVVDDPLAGKDGSGSGAQQLACGLSAQELAAMLRQEYSMDDVPQSAAVGEKELDALLDRSHLLLPAVQADGSEAALPFPAQGVGYEVVAQMDATGLES
jgi:ATP-dependent DNA helicase